MAILCRWLLYYDRLPFDSPSRTASPKEVALSRFPDKRGSLYISHSIYARNPRSGLPCGLDFGMGYLVVRCIARGLRRPGRVLEGCASDRLHWNDGTSIFV